MSYEPVGNDQHTIAANHIDGVFRGLVGGDRAGYACVLCQEIIDLPPDGQAVLKETLVDKGVPEQGGITLIKMAELLSPGVEEDGADLPSFQGKDRGDHAMPLGPEMSGLSFIDTAVGIGVIEVGIQLDIVFVRDKPVDGDASARIVVIISAEELVDIIHTAAISEIGVQAEVQVDLF